VKVGSAVLARETAVVSNDVNRSGLGPFARRPAAAGCANNEVQLVVVVEIGDGQGLAGVLQGLGAVDTDVMIGVVHVVERLQALCPVDDVDGPGPALLGVRSAGTGSADRNIGQAVAVQVADVQTGPEAVLSARAEYRCVGTRLAQVDRRGKLRSAEDDEGAAAVGTVVLCGIGLWSADHKILETVAVDVAAGQGVAETISGIGPKNRDVHVIRARDVEAIRHVPTSIEHVDGPRAAAGPRVADHEIGNGVAVDVDRRHGGAEAAPLAIVVDDKVRRRVAQIDPVRPGAPSVEHHDFADVVSVVGGPVCIGSAEDDVVDAVAVDVAGRHAAAEAIAAVLSIDHDVGAGNAVDVERGRKVGTAENDIGLADVPAAVVGAVAARYAEEEVGRAVVVEVAGGDRMSAAQSIVAVAGHDLEVDALIGEIEGRSGLRESE